MAKTKMSERRDYTLSKTDVIVYTKSRVPRQKQFMILRGPGLNTQEAIEENNEFKKLSLKKRFKLKFMQANSVDDVIKFLKDANTWATAVVFNSGNLVDEGQIIQKTIKKILIPVIVISEKGKITTMMDGLEEALR